MAKWTRLNFRPLDGEAPRKRQICFSTRRDSCFENTSRLKCLDVEKSFTGGWKGGWQLNKVSLSPPPLFFRVCGCWERGGFGCPAVLASSLRVGTLIGVDGARVSRLGVLRNTHDEKTFEKEVNQSSTTTFRLTLCCSTGKINQCVVCLTFKCVCVKLIVLFLKRERENQWKKRKSDCFVL